MQYWLKYELELPLKDCEALSSATGKSLFRIGTSKQSLKTDFDQLSSSVLPSLLLGINAVMGENDPLEQVERKRDYDELLARLSSVASRLGLDVRPLNALNEQAHEYPGTGSRHEDDRVSEIGGYNSKFNQPRMLIYGVAEDATLGLAGYMCASSSQLHQKLAVGEQAIIDEVKDRTLLVELQERISKLQAEMLQAQITGDVNFVDSKGQEIQEFLKEANDMEKEMVETEECLEYAATSEAGSNQKTYQNGWKMDCDQITGEVLPERMVDDGNGGKRGMLLEDFLKHPNAVACNLSRAEVLALRLYTTKAFLRINNPLRDMKRKAEGRQVPLPVTTYHLNEAVKKLRTLAAKSTAKNVPLDLYRGMSNVALEHDFLVEGGTEVAPMSSTEVCSCLKDVARASFRAQEASDSKSEAIERKSVCERELVSERKGE